MAVKELRERMQSVKSTRQITRAMRMVAAAKLMKTQRMALQSRPYAHELQQLVERLATDDVALSLPLLHPHPRASRIGILLMSGSRGLAGGFNAGLIARATALAKRYPDSEVEYIAVGKKGCDHLRRTGAVIAASFEQQQDPPAPQEAAPIANWLTESFVAGRYREILLVYQSFASAGRQEATELRLLPLALPQATGQSVDYICDEGLAVLMQGLLARYLENRIYQSLIETKAGEHLARMTAMTAAGSNADEMLHALALQYNRTRQAAITREIAEVMGGAAANKQQEACNGNR